MAVAAHEHHGREDSGRGVQEAGGRADHSSQDSLTPPRLQDPTSLPPHATQTGQGIPLSLRSAAPVSSARSTGFTD